MLIILFWYKFFTSNRDKKILLSKYLLISSFVLFFAILYLDYYELINTELLIKERFNIFNISRFTSSGIHFKLILDGFNTALSNIKIFLFGSGFGTSYYLIEGYYWSGSKYGNYHSMYITSLVESGIFNALAILIYSFILPIYINCKNMLLGFIVGLFFFNIFYQVNMEPAFWFSLLLFYKINYINASEK